ncbi:MAG: hypothetical protein QM503_04130 [Bacteroidota bacterium]
MNQCIINVVEKSVFIAFNQIVKKGLIEVWMINGKDIPVFSKDILNTNFENLKVNLEKGKYRLEIKMDGQQITKTININ